MIITERLVALLEKRYIAGLIIGAVVLTFVLVLNQSGTLERLELMSRDLRFSLRGELVTNDSILIVTIDEKSVRYLNRKISQWPRTYYAKALQNLTAAGADLIVMDMDLSKPGFNADGEDNVLARAIYDSGNVVLSRYITQGHQVVPLEKFRDGEVGEGFINHLVDKDNILRRIPLVSLEVDEVTGHLEPVLSLAVETARLIIYPDEIPEIDLGATDVFKMGSIEIPYPEGKMLVNYVGPPGAFDQVSFSDVMTGNFDNKKVKDKVILIGNVHPAYHDSFLTPFRTKSSEVVKFETKEIIKQSGMGMPGVEVYAHAINTILEQNYIRTPGRARIVGFMIVISIITTVLFVVLNIRPVVAFLLCVVLFTATGMISYLVFIKFDYFIEIVSYEGIVLLTYFGGVAYHRMQALRDKVRIRQAFGHYVSPQVIEKLLEDPALMKLGGNKEDISVLFIDARDFTAISEKMDPSDVVELLNEFHTAMTKVIFEHNGVLDKYMGDAIMAFYGAPVEMTRHASMACATALDMIRQLVSLHGKWRKEGKPIIEVGIGINTGTMVVGNMGSEMIFDYTVMGDGVNLGSRLESLNKIYSTKIIVSEYTMEAASSDFNFRELDLVRVIGKHQPVRIYELISKSSEERPVFLEKYGEAIKAYRERDWVNALDLFQDVLLIEPDDGPSALYVRRCRELIESPPTDKWDGVFEMTTK
ncbi:MAG: adenylate/guanylate cyclase domain-containing protein [Nitrospirota bacterium]|nr:MAG: adenylate/guanylate cyclase domain-containing protein [Nitrospirota bacterium]